MVPGMSSLVAVIVTALPVMGAPARSTDAASGSTSTLTGKVR